MASVNKVILIGRLGQDPDVNTKSGTAICRMSVATSRKYRDANDEIQEEVEWNRVTCFGKRAEVAGEYLKKGSAVYIEGHLRTRKYTDKQNIERYLTEIVADQMQFLSSKKDSEAEEQPRERKSAKTPAQDDSEDVPF